MEFEWDEEKERANIKKHHISFSLAALVFLDRNVIVRYDEDHSENEDRYIAIGRVNDTVLLLFVSYTLREAGVIRIISARKALKPEKERYYRGN